MSKLFVGKENHKSEEKEEFSVENDYSFSLIPSLSQNICLEKPEMNNCKISESRNYIELNLPLNESTEISEKEESKTISFLKANAEEESTCNKTKEVFRIISEIVKIDEKLKKVDQKLKEDKKHLLLEKRTLNSLNENGIFNHSVQRIEELNQKLRSLKVKNGIKSRNVRVKTKIMRNLAKKLKSTLEDLDSNEKKSILSLLHENKEISISLLNEMLRCLSDSDL